MNCNSSFMGGYYVIGLPNCNKWKMTAICTFLRFGGAPAVTRVPILLTGNIANVLSARLWTELWSQYHSLFFTFKEGKSLRALSHPWCFFRLSFFASSILFLPFNLEHIIHRTLSMYYPLQGPAETMGILLPNFFEICTKTNKQQKETRQTQKHAQIRLLPKKYNQGLGFRYFLFGIFRFFLAGSCEVGSNWVSDCSWKSSKLLLPPLKCASIVNGDPSMSTSSA